MTKSRQFAYVVLAVEIVATAFTIYSIAYSDWDKLSWALPTAIAIPCWAIAVKAPTTCGVTTQKGHPCPNPTTGILLGCAQARNGVHIWAKFFARFGWRRQRTLALKEDSRRPLSIPAPSLSETSTDGDPRPVLVRIAEDRKEFVSF